MLNKYIVAFLIRKKHAHQLRPQVIHGAEYEKEITGQSLCDVFISMVVSPKLNGVKRLVLVHLPLSLCYSHCRFNTSRIIPLTLSYEPWGSFFLYRYYFIFVSLCLPFAFCLLFVRAVIIL